jgi:phenylalanine ammonia-lyase
LYCFSFPASVSEFSDHSPVVLNDGGLSLADLIRVARHGVSVVIDDDPTVLARIEASRTLLQQALQRGEAIYGVTSGFGGMAHLSIDGLNAVELQNNLPWFLKTGCGPRLNDADVRAAMLLRANALMRGASAIRMELIDRLVLFLNHGATPHVYQFGSIGASGDLVPLANISGALIGLGDAFLVDLAGETLPAPVALQRLGLEPMQLAQKEGLALVNGTAVHTAVAAGCLHDSQRMIALVLVTHALMMQGMAASREPFEPFIHRLKPHPGQIFIADIMRELLQDSQLSPANQDEASGLQQNRLLQDRYSVRCLPQFIGPLIDSWAIQAQQLEVEMNAATDNPLFDPASGLSYHGGNFLGQYVALGMDQLRYHLGLLAKHLDAQIALLVEPAFSAGLPESLVGNPGRSVNMGLKGLQITGNALMPLICHQGQPLTDRFPTHAEQFNQNINSQALGSATLTRRSLDLFEHYLAVALIFAVQAVDLRSRLVNGHCDSRQSLSPATRPLYEAVWRITGKTITGEEAFLHDDNQQPLDHYLALLSSSIHADRELDGAVENQVAAIRAYQPYTATAITDPPRRTTPQPAYPHVSSGLTPPSAAPS